jgi:hypothetical protein
MDALETQENIFSFGDEEDVYDPVVFDPETTFGDEDEIDNDTLAFRDAMRDIWRSEGRFEVFLP